MTALINLLIDIAGFLFDWLILRPIGLIIDIAMKAFTWLIGQIARLLGSMTGSIVRQINKGKAQ